MSERRTRTSKLEVLSVANANTKNVSFVAPEMGHVNILYGWNKC